jgi:hypothetical protein
MGDFRFRTEPHYKSKTSSPKGAARVPPLGPKTRADLKKTTRSWKETLVFKAVPLWNFVQNGVGPQ